MDSWLYCCPSNQWYCKTLLQCYACIFLLHFPAQYEATYRIKGAKEQVKKAPWKWDPGGSNKDDKWFIFQVSHYLLYQTQAHPPEQNEKQVPLHPVVWIDAPSWKQRHTREGWIQILKKSWLPTPSTPHWPKSVHLPLVSIYCKLFYYITTTKLLHTNYS